MPNHLLVSLLGVLLANPPRADARPEPATSADVAQVRFRGGIRTDRLSRKQLKAWSRIVEIVMAEDRDGRPLHPRLRQLWDAVHSSSHTVYIEMPHRKGSYIAGRFAITRADPSGKMHEGILFLNPPVIDALSSASAVARPDGLIPFKGLGKNERYAELLGHELAHAVWAFADPNRARLAMPLQSENEAAMREVLGHVSSSGDDIPERVSRLERLSRMMEEPAEAAEVAVWKELSASHRRR